MKQLIAPLFALALLLGAALGPLSLLSPKAQDTTQYARYMRLSTADPATAREGQFYGNSTDHTPKYYNGSGWLTLQTAAVAGANPTANVSLSAVNGVATTYMRSDSAPALDQSITPTWTGSHVFSKAGALSLPAVNITGTPVTGGTGTTTFPLFDLNTSGATARTAMSTSGTMFGMNAPSGFAGNLADLHLNGTSKFSVSSAGAMTTASGATIGGNLSLSGGTVFTVNGQVKLVANADGSGSFHNNLATGLKSFHMGPGTPAIVGTAPTHGQTLSFQTGEELLTIAAAATTDTTMQIPAGAVVYAVSVRVTTVIPTAATFTVTGASTATVFNTAAVAVAANTTDPGTKAGTFYNAAAQSIRITPNLTPGAATGVIRVTIHYYVVTPPTS